jgi:hypothetical protein
VKRFHLLDDVIERIFDGEMTRVQSVHLGFRQILEIGLAALARKENVLLTPENDRLGSLLAKERLPLRIKLDIGAVVVEKIELNTPRIGSIEIAQIIFQLSGLISSGLE